jgi:DNA gyrase/topoisomerase IV subunit B
MTQPAAAYTSDDIKHLSEREAVRLRPHMYIGSTDRRGLHHVVAEILDNACDEALNKHANVITVDVSSDGGYVSIEDNGRGIPSEPNKEGVRGVELVFTKLHAGGKFGDSSAYGSSGGLHGVGASLANFLSTRLEVDIWRSGMHTRFITVDGEFESVEDHPSQDKKRGTKVTFYPLFSRFECDRLEYEDIKTMIENKAYLLSGVKFILMRGGSNPHVIYFEDGMRALYDLCKDGLDQVHQPELILDQEYEGFQVKARIGWVYSREYDRKTFVNMIPTQDGGTHEQACLSGLLTACRALEQGKKPVLSLEDVRGGLRLVLSLTAPKIAFEGNLKAKLYTPEYLSPLTRVFQRHVEQYFVDYPQQAKILLEFMLETRRLRLHQKAQKDTSSRKSPVLNLPAKLADCLHADPVKRELILVEGDSAGGNAKQGRDRHTQAILPLRGKILNTERMSAEDILKNKEIQAIVDSLGCGIGKNYVYEHVRYHKIILLMDADSDGGHILSLILTFFYRHLPDLIKRGHVFIAQPPLFAVSYKNEKFWALTIEDRDRLLKTYPKAEVSRFKGLGEMRAQDLKATTLDAASRQIIPVAWPANTDEVKECDDIFEALMGKHASLRSDAIAAYMKDHATEDI